MRRGLKVTKPVENFFRMPNCHFWQEILKTPIGRKTGPIQINFNGVRSWVKAYQHISMMKEMKTTMYSSSSIYP